MQMENDGLQGSLDPCCPPEGSQTLPVAAAATPWKETTQAMRTRCAAQTVGLMDTRQTRMRSVLHGRRPPWTWQAPRYPKLSNTSTPFTGVSCKTVQQTRGKLGPPGRSTDCSHTCYGRGEGFLEIWCRDRGGTPPPAWLAAGEAQRPSAIWREDRIKCIHEHPHSWSQASLQTSLQTCTNIHTGGHHVQRPMAHQAGPYFSIPIHKAHPPAAGTHSASSPSSQALLHTAASGPFMEHGWP